LLKRPNLKKLHCYKVPFSTSRKKSLFYNVSFFKKIFLIQISLLKSLIFKASLFKRVVEFKLKLDGLILKVYFDQKVLNWDLLLPGLLRLGNVSQV